MDEAETEDIKYLYNQPCTGIAVCFLADSFPAVKKTNRAFIALYVISYTHSHKAKSLLLARKSFCNFLLLHKHMADSPWDNENVNKFPYWRKAKAYPPPHFELTFQHVWWNSLLVSRETIIFWYAGNTEWKDLYEAWEEGVPKGPMPCYRCVPGVAKREAEASFFAPQNCGRHLSLSLLTCHSSFLTSLPHPTISNQLHCQLSSQSHTFFFFALPHSRQ